MKEKFFLLGASGRLGSHWLPELKKFANVISHEHKKFIKSKKNKINLLNYKKIQQFCNANKVSIIINCTGYTNLEKCEKYKENAIRVNYKIVKNITNVCLKNNIKLIHISTDHLFDGKKKIYTEKSKMKPVNMYAKTKIMAENYIKKKLKNFLILRTNFFLNSKGKNTFLDFIIKKLKKKNKIYCWDDIFFSPLHVLNLIKLSNFLILKKKVGIFNVSCNQSLSKYDFAVKIAKHLKFDTNLIQKKPFKKDIVNRSQNMTLCNKKLKKLLSKKQIYNLLDLQSQFKYVQK